MFFMPLTIPQDWIRTFYGDPNQMPIRPTIPPLNIAAQEPQEVGAGAPVEFNPGNVEADIVRRLRGQQPRAAQPPRMDQIWMNHPPNFGNFIVGDNQGAAPNLRGNDVGYMMDDAPAPAAEPRKQQERSDVIGNILRKNKVVFANRPSDEWVLPDTTIGIEIELEGVLRPGRGFEGILPATLEQYWVAHEDGSLHDNGCEFTLRIPLFGEDLRKALHGMMAFAATQKTWKASLRTGIHIHLDARDLTRHQLLGLLGYYILFEPAIYSWIGAGRHANNFCVPWYKYEGSLDQGERILRLMRKFAEGANVSQESILHECDEFHRYAGLNLKSLAEFGSMEFRHLETAINYDLVKDWINIIMSLKKAALEAPESTATIIHEVDRRGVVESMRRIFGHRIATEMMQKEPDCLKEIAATCLPNALHMITVVTAPAQETVAGRRNWERFLENVTKGDHPGFKAWRKANYPKGAELTSETKPPPQQPNPRDTLDELLRNRAVLTEAEVADFRPPFPVLNPDLIITSARFVPVDEQEPGAWQYYIIEGIPVWGHYDMDRGRFFRGATPNV